MTQDKPRLKVVNLASAHFECVYPRCGSPCCKDGNPPCTEAEAEQIDGLLERVLPLLRPAAREWIGREGYRTDVLMEGHPTVAAVEGHCVFFVDEGCALHRLGVEDGDGFRYKPWACSTFPLDRTAQGEWYVRQRGEHEETWDIFCIDPAESERVAAETLGAEVDFAERLVHGDERWRKVWEDER